MESNKRIMILVALGLIGLLIGVALGLVSQRTVEQPIPVASSPSISNEKKGNEQAMSGPVVGTASNFEAEVLKSDIPVVVDFWASWCGPCRMVSPILDELAAEYAGKIKVVKVNVDQEPALANEYRIQSIPTMIFFKNGEQINKKIGADTKQNLKAKFDSLL